VKELFAADRFDRYELHPDARRFEEGMPNFPAMFVLVNALEFLLSIGISDIAAHSGALASRLLAGLVEAGISRSRRWIRKLALQSSRSKFRRRRK
jgi:selenocysteine lyase/cysteine desulfurase